MRSHIDHRETQPIPISRFTTAIVIWATRLTSHDDQIKSAHITGAIDTSLSCHLMTFCYQKIIQTLCFNVVISDQKNIGSLRRRDRSKNQ